MNRLPEDLVEVVMEQNVKVQSEEYLENGVLYQSYKIQSIQNIPHANLQQFRCEICNEIFADSTHLEEHYKIHSDKEKIETTIDKVYGMQYLIF